MRAHHKNECIETISLLIEAHEEVFKYLRAGNKNEAIATLSECQSGAIAIGNIIEKTEGEDAKAVHMLEDYCGKLYRFFQSLSGGPDMSFGQVERDLKKSLTVVKNEIKNNINTTREVVFMPYLAAMWDSLESVWRRMDDDPDITALVVPIPFYDRNPDGSFANMYYEIDRFPKDVPVIDHREYDLKAIHPDAIYIHNPYDDQNLVTSVHPDYYSVNLKEYTDELVYIPYFILGDIDPSDKKQLSEVEQFIKQPVMYNATRIIVQSEPWRKAYISVLSSVTGKGTRRIWEEKIESDTSPKVERVMNLTEADNEIPQEWKRLTGEPGQTRKKIILYNTGLKEFLLHGSEMVEKISRVLSVFHEKQDEVVLLWRPHPLISSTLAAMNPPLKREYDKVVDDYKKAGWGIFDDTPQIDRAIAISDAYYGDWSSVVWMYEKTGKPIMIQDVEI